MTTVNKKPLMAEMLVRHVLGESADFERTCAQRGVSVEEAVRHALKTWSGHDLHVVGAPPLPALTMDTTRTPDPVDCPSGQEVYWLELCEHDLVVLRERQQACFRSKNQEALEQTNRKIEHYIQTIATLRARVA